MANFTKNKNTVSTPNYIAEFLTEYLECKDKRCLDPTAGVGSLLKHCNRSFGIEYIPNVYEELKKEDPDGTYINASVFDSTEWIQQQDIEVVLMNPPFNQDKSTMPKDYQDIYGSKGQDTTKGLYFVKHVADAVGRGWLAAIVPIGSVGDSKATNMCKKEILQHHSLRSVMLLNPDLFYPAAAVQVVCLILELGVPYRGDTQFVDFQEDGMVKDRTYGLMDKNGTWNQIKDEWLRILKERQSQPEKKDGCVTSVIKSITEEDDWNPSRYIIFDIKPTPQDFYNTVKAYIDFQIKQKGLAKFLQENPELLPPKQIQLQRVSRRIAQLQAEQSRLVYELMEDGKNENR
jgi:type I restriction-modification system DNA methylase subunit